MDNVVLMLTPWLAVVVLPVNTVDDALASAIRSLESARWCDRGMFRPVPLGRAEPYRQAVDAISSLVGSHVVDEGRAILADVSGERRAVRVVERLTN